MGFDELIMKEVCQELPMGVFVVKQDKTICFWNKWLVDKAKIKSEQALGKTLVELIPNIDTKRFDWAIEGAIENNIPQVMSNTLNEYLIPIHIDNSAYDSIQHMQQQIKIIPVSSEDAKFAAVMITDITDLVLQKQTLVKMAIRLEQDSYHDPLTGAYNRRYMWDWIDRNMHLASREKFSIGCCAFDLDNFKSVNDSYGHDKGDRVLQDFCKILNESKRRSSLIVRVGGEEFVALLPIATLKDAVGYANRVKSMISETSIAGFKKGQITTSIGCAEWDPSDPISSEELLKKADDMLYKAKDAGRNCIMPQLSNDSNKNEDS